jgi:hypothetical protein
MFGYDCSWFVKLDINKKMNRKNVGLKKYRSSYERNHRLFY